MAKITLSVEDTMKDGQQAIKGRFDTEGAPEAVNGMPPLSTPAQMYMEAIKRLWDAGMFNTVIRLVVPDLLYKNDMIKKQRLAAMEAAGAALVQQTAPASVNLVDKEGAVDAEVVEPGVAPPAMPLLIHPDESVVNLQQAAGDAV